MVATDEFGLIARCFAPLAAGEPGAFGLLDDAAVLTVPAGRDLVVTADMLVEGVHFRADDPADDLGRKLLAVNLSDLAAKGAQPRAYVLTLALPRAWDASHRETWLAGFVAGLAAMQSEYALPLIGGDTVSTPGPLTLSLTAFGTTLTDAMLRRAGARAGDEVWVSGTIGDGVLGLRVLQGEMILDSESAAALVARYRRPQPRVALGLRLADLAHACADVSDGLVADLGHVCAASAVTATIEAACVPLSAAGRAATRQARKASDESLILLLAQLLTGGDDYELVFTAPPERAAEVRAAGAATGIPVTPIGRIDAPPRAVTAEAPAVLVLDPQGRPIPCGCSGWRHF